MNADSYNFKVFVQVVLVNLALNQTWTALLICLICAFPKKAFRISPIIASVAGFTSGFFIPVEDIPWWYVCLCVQCVHIYTHVRVLVRGFSCDSPLPSSSAPRYRWLVYINPNYYGFSSSAFLLLDDFKTDCEGTAFECYTSSGEYILSQFDFDQINPYLHILVRIMEVTQYN